jgi:hypothetical protein
VEAGSFERLKQAVASQPSLGGASETVLLIRVVAAIGRKRTSNARTAN